MIDVFRRKLLFPALKNAIETHAGLHEATVVLVEDKSSGSSLIQQLRADGFSLVQAAPALEGNKIMRLNGQTPMIEGGFVLFPKRADWLETYLSELLSFPSSSYNDQVDSTVYALAWLSENPRYTGTLIKRSSIRYYTTLPQGPRTKHIMMSWDTALKDGGQGDWTVCTVWLRYEGVYYLLHMERGIYGFSELRTKYAELNQNYKPAEILFEETTTGIAIERDDNNWRYKIKLLPIELDRKGRVYVMQSKFEQGIVQFPSNASFMREVENELLSYPYGQTDDIVDSISQVLNYRGSTYTLDNIS